MSVQLLTRQEGLIASHQPSKMVAPHTIEERIAGVVAHRFKEQVISLMVGFVGVFALTCIAVAFFNSQHVLDPELWMSAALGVGFVAVSIFILYSPPDLKGLRGAKKPPQKHVQRKKQQLQPATLPPKQVVKCNWYKMREGKSPDSTSQEEQYFISLYKAMHGSDEDKISHFEMYAKEDAGLGKGAFSITPGSPWEEFAREMQKEMSK